MTVALITGATGGLGRALAHEHAKRGGDLILVGRNQMKLASLKAQLHVAYPLVLIETIQADFAKGGQVQQVFDAVQTLGWQVDYLINNAGFGGQGKFISREKEADLTMLRVNAAVPTAFMKLFLPLMVKQGYGHVLNVSSAAAFFPGPEMAEYYATKAYLTSLGNAIWQEMKATRVTVTTLMPGPMETGFATAGDLTTTKLFKPGTGADPALIAKVGYKGMLAGKLNVVAGLPSWAKVSAKLYPLLPKRLVLKVIENLQTKKK